MPRNRTPGKDADDGKTIQVNVRVPVTFVDRLEDTAEKLGLDRSALIKLMIAEKLHEYEERARLAQGPASSAG